MVFKEQVEPSSLRIYCTKNQPKWTKGKKVMALPSRGGHFYKKNKILDRTAHNLFSNPSKKSLNITLLPIELEYDL